MEKQWVWSKVSGNEAVVRPSSILALPFQCAHALVIASPPTGPEVL